jgi:two-component system chemotaxis response regulator CheY
MNDTTSVLIVDDSRVSRMMARSFILTKQPGWDVVEAATGEEALEKAKTLAPRLVLMDVNMPGMGGIAAAELLRTLCPHAHISLCTANVQNAMRKRAAELGIGFLEKPITEARIHALIDSLE